MARRIYFLSDMHLGAHYLPDARANEQRLVRFLDSIAADAAEVYLLGDVLDYWFEYRTVVPRGYVRFLGALARLSDAGVKITWLTGNHDVWLFDYLRDEVGLTVRKHPFEITRGGVTFFLSHGDDVGRQRRSYRFMRWCFYSRVCQVLYAAIHPRWTYAIAHGWSTQNRTSRNPVRVAGSVEESIRNLLNFSRAYLKNHTQVAHFIYGHLHVARQVELEPGHDVTLLGDWISQFTYAVFDGHSLQLKKFGES